MLPAVDADQASPDAAALLRDVQAGYGTVPTLMRVMANSPALLRGYLQLATSLQDGLLPGDVRERIAIAVAAGNSCRHCLVGHELIARNVVKIPATEIEAARTADSAPPRLRALLQFAAAVNTGRGAVGDAVLESARALGVTDAELAEVVGHVAVNVLTNYLAKAAQVAPDVPGHVG
jgi:uncharacterized peroxidase-related enzyme